MKKYTYKYLQIQISTNTNIHKYKYRSGDATVCFLQKSKHTLFGATVTFITTNRENTLFVPTSWKLVQHQQPNVNTNIFRMISSTPNRPPQNSIDILEYIASHFCCTINMNICNQNQFLYHRKDISLKIHPTKFIKTFAIKCKYDQGRGG